MKKLRNSIVLAIMALCLVVQLYPQQTSHAQGTTPFDQLPFQIIDRRSEVSPIMPDIYADDRPRTDTIVIHEAWIGRLCPVNGGTPEMASAVDVIALSKSWKANNGWRRPGYPLVIRYVTTGDYAPVEMEAGLNSMTWGVTDSNDHEFHIAFVGYPCDGPPTPQQLNSLIAVTRAAMSYFNVPVEMVKAHKELRDHSDPAGLDMNIFRCQVSGRSDCSNGGIAYALPQGSIVGTISESAKDIPIDFITSSKVEGNGPDVEPFSMDTARKNAQADPRVRNIALILGVICILVVVNSKDDPDRRKFALMGLLVAVVAYGLANGGSVPMPADINATQDVGQGGGGQIAIVAETPISSVPSNPGNGSLGPIWYDPATVIGRLWGDLIIGNSNKQGIDPNLAATSMWGESCGDKDARNSVDIGLMQLNVKTFSAYSVEQLFVPETNVQLGVEHLALQLRAANNNIKAMYAGYNGGPKAIAWFQGMITKADYIAFLRSVGYTNPTPVALGIDPPTWKAGVVIQYADRMSEMYELAISGQVDSTKFDTYLCKKARQVNP